MFSPSAVRRRQVVYPGQVLKLVDGSLGLRDAELVLQLPRGCHSDAELLCFNLLLLEVVQRVRTTCVRPHVREGDLLRGTLLK